MALFAAGGVILTPELRTTADWPAWLQLGIAISLLSGRTCVLGAIGILVLYGYAVSLYGVFHLTDYPIFLGIAAYLALTSCTSERLRASRMPILFVTLCISLMWGAVEKWAYPQWTLPLLSERPYLTFGIPAADFMIIAGFVEFALAFYILTGIALVRLAILVLLTIFVAAIADFGKVDAIGHLPIIVPLIVISARGDEADRVAALELGADDYLAKPFSPRELIARCHSVLRRGQRVVARKITCSDLVVDADACRVSRHGELVPLTTKETELLVCLAEHVGKPVRRRDLAERVWGTSLVHVTRSLDVHMSSLRQKLGERPDGEGYIDTVHGVGYRLQL